MNLKSALAVLLALLPVVTGQELAESTSADAAVQSKVDSLTPVYIYEFYFDDPDQPAGRFAMQRVVFADGSFEMRHYDPGDLKSATLRLAYDPRGARREGLDKGQSHQAMLWFWKAVPKVGQCVEVTRSTRVFGPDREVAHIKQNRIEFCYLRDEILVVGESRKKCHVVRESSVAGEGSTDLKWLDDAGMLVRAVHIVGGETRTTLLADKIEPGVRAD